MILVSGATGTIGGPLVNMLSAAGEQVPTKSLVAPRFSADGIQPAYFSLTPSS